MVHQFPAAGPRWQARLEIVGSEIFLRYRKRLMSPGIVSEIRRDYPSLGLIDVLVRVAAARQIIRDGDDFTALAAIRAGGWLEKNVAQRRHQGVPDQHIDRTAQPLVTLGRGLFAAFCTIVLLAAVDGNAQEPAPLPGLLAALAIPLVIAVGGRLGSDR